MTSGKRDLGVLLAVGFFALTVGPAWAAKGTPTTGPAKATRSSPPTRPARPAPAIPTTGPAKARPQTETIVESGTANIFLSGIGTHWTLVAAPQHGTLKIFTSSPTWGLVAWTQGVTATYYRPSGETMLTDRGLGYVFYYPTPGYAGPDSFTWHASTGSETSADAVCNMTVVPNHPPVARNQSVTCVPGIVNSGIALDYSHADAGDGLDHYGRLHPGQTMTFTLVSAPAHGTMKYWDGGRAGTKGEHAALKVGTPVSNYGWNYTPDAGYTGADGFTWKCNDTFVDSATATVSITVTPNPTPVAKGPSSRPYTGPGDIVPGAMAWYGCRGYSNAVAATGKQKAMHIIRYSDGAGMDVLIKPNGDLDTASAVAFCEGTPGRVTVWYDQSGHGNDLLGGCHAESPPLLTTVSRKVPSQAGRPCPEFTPDSPPCVECQADDRQFTNRRFFGASPIGTFAIVEVRYAHGGILMEMNAINVMSYGAGLGICNSQAVSHVGIDTDLTKTRIVTSADETAHALHAVQAVMNGGSSVLNVDGTCTPGNLDAANVANGLDSGGCYGGGGLIGKITEEGVWPAVFSSEEQAAMYENQKRYWHIPEVAGVSRGVAKAVYLDEAPPINGTLANQKPWLSWQKCTPLLLGKVASTEIGPLQTTAHVLMNQQNLYVGWQCMEKDTDALVANGTERDEVVGSDDSVELFLSADGKTRYHFIVNPKGVFSDGKGDLNGKEDLAWNSSAIVKTSISPGRSWSGTMSIPLKDLAAASGKNQTWLLNIKRTKPVKDKAGVTTFIESSWSSAKSSGHDDAAGWGTLTGVNIP